MNIKTTLFLLVILLGVGGYLLFTREKSEPTPKHETHTLLDIKADDITRFVITGSDGKKIAAQKTGLSMAWKLTEPVNATAEAYKISSLLESLTSMKSTEEVPATGANAPSTGMDKPIYTVELYVNDKVTKFVVGDQTGIGSDVYVKLAGKDTVDVVSDSIVSTLDKPASDLRKAQLFETASPSVQQITVTHKDGSEVVLQKQGEKWQMIKPVAEAADSSAVSDLISAVVNMTPVEWVDDPSQAFGLNKPTAVVTFSALSASTQPTTNPTTMPGAVKVIFGGYDDLQKKNIFVQIPDGTTVKVAASVLDSLNKKPLDLRDKDVLNLDPSQVTHLSINMDQPATTQPTTQPAVTKLVVLQRRKKDTTLGPVLPSTNPTTAPTTAPAPKTDWMVMDKTSIDADDTKVASLLSDLHPLRADKYLETPPTSKPVKIYTVMLTSSASGTPAVLTLTDPGNEAAVIGSYNGLLFETPRTILTDLGADFVKSATAATPAPTMMPPGMPPGMGR